MHNITVVFLLISSGCAKHPATLPSAAMPNPPDNTGVKMPSPSLTDTPVAEDEPGVVLNQIFVDWEAGVVGTGSLTLVVAESNHKALLSPPVERQLNGTLLFVVPEQYTTSFESVVINPRTREVWANMALRGCRVSVLATVTTDQTPTGTAYTINNSATAGSSSCG